MRISDWSSDVCSSDLLDEHPAALYEGAEVHLLLPELQLAGFDLREVEQIVDEAQQVLPGAVDVLRVLVVLRVIERPEGLRRHHLGKADDGVERRAQLVRSEEHTSELQSLMRI